jgi:uncharacterized protein DUF3467
MNEPEAIKSDNELESVESEKAHSEQAPITRSEIYKEIYVDTVSAGLSPWDIRLIFGRLTSNPNDIVVNEQQVSLIMSPQHAKALLSILIKNIVVFENTYGVIGVPPEFQINLSPKSQDSKQTNKEPDK